MRIAPQAKTNDGLFDIIILGDITRGEVLANIHKLYNGTMAEHEKVQTLLGKKVSLNSKSEILIETDGELPGKLPASFVCSVENSPKMLVNFFSISGHFFAVLRLPAAGLRMNLIFLFKFEMGY